MDPQPLTDDEILEGLESDRFWAASFLQLALRAETPEELERALEVLGRVLHRHRRNLTEAWRRAELLHDFRAGLDGWLDDLG